MDCAVRTQNIQAQAAAQIDDVRAEDAQIKAARITDIQAARDGNIANLQNYENATYQDQVNALANQRDVNIQAKIAAVQADE
jgi:hypothetical protein